MDQHDITDRLRKAASQGPTTDLNNAPPLLNPFHTQVQKVLDHFRYPDGTIDVVPALEVLSTAQFNVIRWFADNGNLNVARKLHNELRNRIDNELNREFRAIEERQRDISSHAVSGDVLGGDGGGYLGLRQPVQPGSVPDSTGYGTPASVGDADPEHGGELQAALGTLQRRASAEAGGQLEQLHTDGVPGIPGTDGLDGGPATTPASDARAVEEQAPSKREGSA